jgi:hypothetical protein
MQTATKKGVPLDNDDRVGRNRPTIVGIRFVNEILRAFGRRQLIVPAFAGCSLIVSEHRVPPIRNYFRGISSPIHALDDLSAFFSKSRFASRRLFNNGI